MVQNLAEWEDIVWDLETNGLLPDVSTIHMISVCDIHSGKVAGFTDHPELIKLDPHYAGSVAEGLALIQSAAFAGTMNGWNYDVPVAQKLYPQYDVVSNHIDLRTLGNTIWSRETLIYEIDIPLIARGKMPEAWRGRETLAAWACRAGQEQKATYSGNWEGLNQEMWEYGLQDARTTASVATWMMRHHLPWVTIWLEQVAEHIMAAATAHGWRFDITGAEHLLVRVKKELNDVQQQITNAYKTGWWSVDVSRCNAKIFQSPTSGGWSHIPKNRDTGYLVNKKSITYYLCKLPARSAKPYEGGRPFTPLKHVAFNPQSRDHLARMLLEFGWRPKQETNTGKPVVDEATIRDLQYPVVPLILRSFQLAKMAAYIRSWIKSCRAGRIHCHIRVNGTVTRRMTHSGPNISQVPSARKPYGRESRQLFLADKNWTLIACDAEGLELRILANEMYPFDAGALAQTLTHGDFHLQAATQLANNEEVGKKIRDTNKSTTYCLLYGGQDAKLGRTYQNCVALGAPKLSGAKVRQAYYSAFPGLERLIDNLKFQKADTGGDLPTIDGWRMKSRSDHSILNQRIQSSGAIFMKAVLCFTLLLLEESGLPMGEQWHPLMMVHDDVIITADPAIAEEVGRCMLAAYRHASHLLGIRVSMEGALQRGENWSQTH